MQIRARCCAVLILAAKRRMAFSKALGCASRASSTESRKNQASLLGIKPLLKGFSAPDLKGLFEISIDVFDSNEECETTIGLKNFARACISYDLPAPATAKMTERYLSSIPGQIKKSEWPSKERTCCSSESFSDIGTGENRRTSGTGLSEFIPGLEAPQIEIVRAVLGWSRLRNDGTSSCRTWASALL